MACCPHCADAEDFFTERSARRELRRYRRKGATGTTKHLMRMLLKADVGSGTLLDVGGGIGAIQHELLTAGIPRALHVDASRDYLRASMEEGQRRGHADRVEYEYGDFVELADRLDRFDVVTLDRVVCCYPDMPRLIAAAASRARNLIGLSFPRSRAGVRLGLGVANLWFRVRGSAFRTYLHPPDAIGLEIERHGFRKVDHARSFVWQIELWVLDRP